MNRDELELLRAVRAVSEQLVPFVLDFMAGELDAERELDFARQLAEVAVRIRRHGEERQRRLVVDGEVAVSKAASVDRERTPDSAHRPAEPELER